MSRRKQKITDIAPKLHHVYGYFWPEIRSQRKLIAGSVLTLVLSVFVRLLEPWPLKYFLDYVIPTANADPETTLPRFLRGLEPTTLMAVLAASLVVIATARAWADYISRVGFFVIGNRAVLKIRSRVYRHLQDLSVVFHAKARTGDLVVRVTRDVSLVRDVTATALLPLVAHTAILIGMVSVMLWLRWQLALLAMSTLPLFWLSSVRLGRRIRRTARRQRQREGAMATTAAEAIGAIGVIKAMGLEDQFASTFDQRNKESQKEDLKANRLSVKLGRTVDILLSLSSAIVLWFGGRLVLQGEMSPGDIVIFLTYLKRSFRPAQDMAKYIARLAKAAASGERVIDLLNKTPRVTDRPDALPAPKLQGHLTFDHVAFAFHPEAPVLDGVCIALRPGERVALVGPSGGGKSTLLGMMLRLYDPQTGTVTVDGRDIRDYTAGSIRAQTATVLQDAILLAGTIHDNIACGVDEASREEVIAAATLANAHSFISRLPNGYDSAVGERGATLSRGQRQRLAIARAALRITPLLLLDEPTTGLDEENERAVVEALVRLSHGRTTVLVTHNLQLAAQADRILFLDQGKIVEQGTHRELLNAQGRYAAWMAGQSANRHSSPRSLSRPADMAPQRT
ncbi:MAG: ABC transporter ATP-binding protein [Planctomycetales bacterium]|nr:ABC transporter ATP-binding protein [Planctomycetales bacterium]